MNGVLIVIHVLFGVVFLYLPSVLFYGAAAVAVVRLFKRPSILTFAVVAFPFLLHGLIVLETLYARSSDQRTLSAVSVEAFPAAVPSVLVGFCDRSNRIANRGITLMACRSRRSHSVVEYFAHEAGEAPQSAKSRSDDLIRYYTLPKEYVEVRTGEDTAAHKSGLVKAGNGGPFELYYVVNGTTRLLAVGGPTRSSAWVSFPLRFDDRLTGLHRTEDTMRTHDQIEAFVVDAIDRSRQQARRP